MARIAIVTGAASSIGQALATRNGRKVGVALTCLSAGCALALRDPGRSPMERPGRDAYRRAARFYDQVFGRLNAGLRGLGLKMFLAMRGWRCWMWGAARACNWPAPSTPDAGCRASSLAGDAGGGPPLPGAEGSAAAG